jgi:hemolysin activation/secretion protein
MHSQVKSFFWIMILALFLDLVVFAGSGRAETKLSGVKAQEKAELAKIEAGADVQAKARAEQAAKIEQDYKANNAKVEAEYEVATQNIQKQRKDAGVNGVGALFADKRKAAIIKSIDKEEARAKAEYKEAKAKIDADYKLAKAQLNAQTKIETNGIKNAKIKIEKDYEKKNIAINSTAKAEKIVAEAKAKAELDAKKKMESDKNTKAKTDREGSAAEAKAKEQEEKRLKAEAEVQTKAEAIAKERVDAEKKQIETAYEKAKTEKETSIALAEKDKKLKLYCLEIRAKADAEALEDEDKKIDDAYETAKTKADVHRKNAKKGNTAVVKEHEKAKISIDEKSTLGETVVDYKQAKEKADTDHRTAKLDLEAKKKLLAQKAVEEKSQINTEYEKAVAKANLKFQYEDVKDSFARISVAEDTSPKLVVKEIKIGGNTLISTADLLANMPAVYGAANPKSNSGEKEIYDFRILHEIILDPGQEREVSKNTVQGFTRYILSKYQKKKYAGIYVYVNAKAVKGIAELEDGILPIEIIEGKVEKVTIDRYDFDRQKTEKKVLKDSVLKSWSPAKEGQTIKKKELDDFVRLLNLNPDRYVSAVIARGDKPDTLSLGYDVYEANPWHWYAQTDNSGIDKRQWNPRVGVTNTNLTGRDDRASLMYQAAPDGLEKNYALFGNYEFPFLTPRLRLGFYAGYSQYQITPETGAGINFRGNGSFYGSTLRYNVFQINDWFFDLLGSLSQERSKVTPSLGIAADVDVNLWGTGAELHRSSNMSDTSFSFNRFKSMGGSDEEDFTKARLDTDPDFSIYTLSAAHRQFLNESKIHELRGSFRSITSDQRLIPAKMTAFGGLYSVRGYKEDGIVADGGILASLQYRFDLTKYMEKGTSNGEEKSDVKKNEKIWPPKVSLLTFTDYGQAKIKNPVPGETETQDLLGAGVGTAVELGEHVYGAAYYSLPLRNAGETEKGDGRWNFNFIYRW